MKRNIKYIYIFASILLILVSIFGYITRLSFKDNIIPNKLPSYLKESTISIFDEESYINKYFNNNISTYKELKNQSDLIVVGEIVGDRTKFNGSLKTVVKVNEVLKSKKEIKDLDSIIVYEPSDFQFDTYYVHSGYPLC